jgi:hypothetical protein
MKKLESLNNSLFEKFENNKINNLVMCVGGQAYATTANAAFPKGDTMETTTHDGPSTYYGVKIDMATK